MEPGDDNFDPDTPAPDTAADVSAEKSVGESAPEPGAGPAPVDGPETGGGRSPVRDSDPELVAAAQAAYDAAASALEEERDRYDDAEDALADAESAVSVAEAKVEDFEADETLPEWRKATARAELGKARRAWSRAVRRMNQASERVAAAETAADDSAQWLDRARRTPAPEPEAPPVRRFASVAVFVEEYVVPNFVHKLGDNYAGRWCAMWWEHTEAVTRLEAAWEAFEVMRRENPPALSTWIKDHLDAHMDRLTGVHGVFHGCDAGRNIHEAKRPWATIAPPEGLFEHNDKAQVQGRTAPTTEPSGDDEAYSLDNLNRHDSSAYRHNGTTGTDCGAGQEMGATR